MMERVVAGEQPLTLLCVEGSIIHGPNGTGRFDTFEGRPKRDVVAELCERADYVLAMGSCARFGGIPAAPPNPSESTGLQYTNSRPGGLLEPEWRSRAGMPVINLSACPADATTMIETMTRAHRGPRARARSRRAARRRRSRACRSRREKRCRTADKVGYACYGCIGPKFPLSKAAVQAPSARRGQRLSPDEGGRAWRLSGARSGWSSTASRATWRSGSSSTGTT